MPPDWWRAGCAHWDFSVVSCAADGAEVEGLLSMNAFKVAPAAQ